jgi:catalase
MKLINIKKADNSETNDLAKNIVNGQDKFLTINQGLRINDDQNSLKSGERGTTLFRSLFCL